MPPLLNPGYEALARGRADGLPWQEAYRLAGYRSKNYVYEMNKRQEVVDRLRELLAERAPGGGASLPQVIDKLIASADVAGQSDSAASLTAAKGLLVEAVKLKMQLDAARTKPGDYNDARPDMSDEEWFRTYAPPD